MALTEKQHAKLDWLAEERPGTVVVGLAPSREGESVLIRYANGVKRRIMPRGSIK